MECYPLIFIIDADFDDVSYKVNTSSGYVNIGLLTVEPFTFNEHIITDCEGSVGDTTGQNEELPFPKEVRPLSC